VACLDFQDGIYRALQKASGPEKHFVFELILIFLPYFNYSHLICSILSPKWKKENPVNEMTSSGIGVVRSSTTASMMNEGSRFHIMSSDT
jgi:hypothetical protein